MKILEYDVVADMDGVPQRELQTGCVRFIFGSDYFEIMPTSDEKGITVRCSGGTAPALAIHPNADNQLTLLLRR